MRDHFALCTMPSGFCDERQAEEINTIVVHSMFAEESEDSFSLSKCKQLLDSHEVSAHYLIGRDGTVCDCVSEDLRAWHAGVSVMPLYAGGSSGVNHFSIGIELIGSYNSGFTVEQYEMLLFLCGDVSRRHPIRHILGHSDVAPDRKTDPWCFDWHLFTSRFRSLYPRSQVQIRGSSGE